MPAERPAERLALPQEMVASLPTARRAHAITYDLLLVKRALPTARVTPCKSTLTPMGDADDTKTPKPYTRTPKPATLNPKRRWVLQTTWSPFQSHLPVGPAACPADSKDVSSQGHVASLMEAASTYHKQKYRQQERHKR